MITSDLKMREYEGLFIIRPDLDDEGIKRVEQQIKVDVQKNQGKILYSKFKGKKKLSYPIKKRTEGIYLIINFNIHPEQISNLNRTYRLNNDILRIVIVRSVKKVIKSVEAIR